MTRFMWKRWKAFSLYVYTAVGRRAPLYAGACPRILLSYFSEEEKQKYIEETDLKQFADGTIVDKKQLLEVLQMAKRKDIPLVIRS